MPDKFHTQIRSALADEQLQLALDLNARNRQQSWITAFTSLPEPWHILRQRAHNVRAEIIANLDQILAQFVENAQDNGLIVHIAADASQATAIVRNIAQRHGAKLIAKSKSMLSEEIGLNRALEADGLQVVETDLGEYIVQLRDEPPAHIITPAVHLQRSEVGQTFHERLNVPYSEDIPTITNYARSALREVFLKADIGISGVNFGIADDGMLCIVTNEGNGRMVTTLPPVHIALMGVERIVRNLDELALMLSLLARSSTGQKITVYTNLIKAPRQPDDVDGPNERHIILIDNGRRALRESLLSEALYCIRCGACLNACPVFQEIGGHSYISVNGAISAYSGPIGSVISPALFGREEFGQLARASSLCGACKDACPVAIDLPKLLLRIRAGELNSPHSPPNKPNAPRLLAASLRLFSWAAASPTRYQFAQRLAGLFSRIISPRSRWMKLPASTGWGYSKDFPRPAEMTFQKRWQQRIQQGPAEQHVDIPEPQMIVDSNSPAEPIKKDQGDLRAEFKLELEALGGEFISCSRSNLSQKIINCLHQAGATTIQSWEADQFLEILLPELQKAGIKITHDPDPGIKVGLTAARAAVAETGSLIISTGPGRPLTASLLPAVHLAILKEEDILPDLTHALSLEEIREASSTVIISGPSRTADIEMTLTIGVHGPGQLYVFCLEQ